MRAVLCHEIGTPEILKVGEAADPVAGPGEAVIDIKAAGLNFADTLMVAGKYQEKPDFPFTPGLEAGGIISSVGEGVTDLKAGDRVMGLLSRGAFAEKGKATAESFFKIPDGMDYASAAAFPVAYGTAHGALTWRSALRPGELLLVHGAAGGAGLAAVECGKALGATVIATAGGPEKLKVAEDHGADYLIDYKSEEVAPRVKEIASELGKTGADVVFDPVGGDVWDASLRCVAFDARMVIIGFAAGRIPQIPANILLVKNVSAVGFYWGSYRKNAPHMVRNQYDELFRWHSEGKLRPHISHHFPMEQAADAMNALLERRSTGKVILDIGE